MSRLLNLLAIFSPSTIGRTVHQERTASPPCLFDACPSTRNRRIKHDWMRQKKFDTSSRPISPYIHRAGHDRTGLQPPSSMTVSSTNATLRNTAEPNSEDSGKFLEKCRNPAMKDSGVRFSKHVRLETRVSLVPLLRGAPKRHDTTLLLSKGRTVPSLRLALPWTPQPSAVDLIRFQPSSPLRIDLSSTLRNP